MMPRTVFIVPPEDSWFANRTTHHIRLPRNCIRVVQDWIVSRGLSLESSVYMNIFADGTYAGGGSLNFEKGHLTGVKTLFSKLSIGHWSDGLPTLSARLHFHEDRLRIFFRRLRPEDSREQDRREADDPTRSALIPFSEKCENAYLVDLDAVVQERSKEHESLVNRFAEYLRLLGYNPVYSKAIDLALQNPPLIVEAKAIRSGGWIKCVREAVAQLHEYRHFNVSLRNANLLFLASAPVPAHWMEYLKTYHRIRSAWPLQDVFHVDDVDELLPVEERT